MTQAQPMRAVAPALLVAAVAALVPAERAEACGGFFCDNNQPVNQAAERIIFVDDGAGGVTAVVQILYQGPAEEFSWILPVPGVPTVDVSSNAAFTRLQAASNPTYTLTTEVEGTCAPDPSGNVPLAAGGDGDGDNEEGGGVNVVASGAVGPYDYEVIMLDDELEDPAAVAVQWLNSNGYDTGDIGPDLIRPYLEDGMNLIGFRLQKTANAGEIRPVVLGYQTENPMIPIKLTAVAANDDMGVLVWNVASSRAVPVNYRTLVLNEAVINWFNPASTYNDVINLAADEADGHGFVTEQAGPTSDFDEAIFGPAANSNWQQMLAASWDGDEEALIAESASSYGGWDGYVTALEQYVTLPGGVTAEELASCPYCYLDGSGSMEVNVDAFLGALADDVIAPMQATQNLLGSQPYVTRMYTTMSARDMTEDPVFDFNPDLEDYDNAHTATRVIYCNPLVSRAEASWSVELPQGDEVFGSGNTWPFDTGDMPANRLIVQDGLEGDGDVVVDNSDDISATVAAGRGSDADDGSCGCTSTGEPRTAPGWIAVCLLLAARVARPRRRRR